MLVVEEIDGDVVLAKPKTITGIKVIGEEISFSIKELPNADIQKGDYVRVKYEGEIIFDTSNSNRINVTELEEIDYYYE